MKIGSELEFVYLYLRSVRFPPEVAGVAHEVSREGQGLCLCGNGGPASGFVGGVEGSQPPKSGG